MNKGSRNHGEYYSFILVDLVCLSISHIIAHLIRHNTLRLLFDRGIYSGVWLLLILVDLLVIVLTNTFHNALKRGYYKEFIESFKQIVLVFSILTIGLFTIKSGQMVSRSILWMTMVLHLIIGYSGRIGWKKILIKKRFSRSSKVKESRIIVTEFDNVQNILDRLERNLFDNRKIKGMIIADRDATGTMIDDIPVLSSLEDAPEYICREWVDEVYISTAAPPLHLIEWCIEMGVTTHQELRSVSGDRQFIDNIAGAYVITSTMTTATPAQLLAKRTLDIAGGVVGSLLALMIMAIIGPKIKKASPGPILFKQERIGKNGKRFVMYKIRSMVMDADEKKAELMKENRLADNMMFKLDFDPRIIGNKILPDGTHETGIGEFIRKTSLDEFPQFFNVLSGQMSLVGTRPPTPDEWEKYEYRHRARLSIKPGITGMWQVSGRSNITDFEEVIKLDTEYINNWSLGLDISLLLKTVVNVFKRDGAL